ncbi:hypothetical protein HZS_6737 [Henneguya salminicola]|nr:hypothetical protein HZS_6737 [Henneguya salminicola]
MLLTSMFRNLGMVSRSVSGFSIGHDNNKDGVLTIYLDNKTLKHLPNSETLWNFHAWTNVYIKRKDIEIIGISNNQMQISWQHADGTPQERSEGIYRCGPYPIRLLRKHIHKDIIPYDGTPVYYSINYTSKYILVGEDGVAITTSKKKDSCRLIITTGVNGKKIDITDEYKSTKKIIKDSMEEKKIKLTTKVPTASHLYSPMSYEISVKNASINEPTILSITVELLNIHGNKHTDHPVFFKSIVFQESEYIVSGITDPIDIKKPTDLSMSILKWEIECYDQSTNFITEIEKNTFVLPCFTGVLITTTGSLLMGKISIKLKIKNDLNIDVKNCKIETVAIGSREKQIINIESFLANSEREFSFSISITTPGSHVIESFMFSKYFNGKIAKKSIYILRNG